MNQLAFETLPVSDFGGHIPDARKETARSGFTLAQPGEPRPQRRPPQNRFATMLARSVDPRWFLVKQGDKLRRPLHYFETTEDAHAWQKTVGQDRAEQLWEEIRLRDFISDASCRGLTNMPREGVDYRGGADATPERFMAEVRPYGVQFGLWQDNRDVCLNQAYDGLKDLAGFLGWPLDRICFNGTLALAFGARGHGGAAAHYELGHRCINLTRNKGPGCLAHEWAHALDHHISGSDCTTADPRVKRLLKALPPAIVQRCRNADDTRSSKYFSNPCEVFARCFEAWAKTGITNDYLVNILPVERFKAPGRYPYPLAEEMPVVSVAFQELFASL